MKFPIIELREHNLFVLDAFHGTFVEGGLLRTRHNLAGNRTCHVIDSNGDLWSFALARTDHAGLRKLVGQLVWNLSSDYYTVATETDIPIARFRELVEPHRRDLRPDDREMAKSLLASLEACAATDSLRSRIALLNL
jgi:hypothetical protein